MIPLQKNTKRRTMRPKTILTIITLSFFLSVQAQTGKFFNTDKQLSSSFVTQVYVDKDGFLWTTTRDGINRYDGYQFRVLKRENASDRTLVSNYVNTILQDRNGLFYFGMYGAMQTWDGKRFYSVTMTDQKGREDHSFVNCFLERANGDVLAGTSGLGVLKFSDKTHAQQIGGPLGELHTINSLIEDHQGRLWMVTEGRWLISYDGQKMQRYSSDRQDLLMNALGMDREGQIYVGTSNAGLFRLEGNQLVHIEGTGSRAVSSLFCDHHGQLVIGYDGEGIAIYDAKRQTISDNPFFSMEVDLTKSKVYSIAEDKSGNLWFGLLQKGIYKQPIYSRGFGYMGYRMGPRNTIGNACVASTFIDRKGRIWIGTDKDGLYCLDDRHQPIRHYKEGIPTTIMAIGEDADGRIWIGSYREGFGYIDAAGSQYHPVRYPDEDHLIVMDLAIDRENRLWLATLKYGLVCMNIGDGSFKTYTTAPKAESDRQVNSIVNNYVSQISLSPDERRIYVSTSMGLCCLDIASNSWTKAFGVNCPDYSMPVRIAREYNNRIWVGTNEGLYCYDLKGQLQGHLTRDNGLADNGVSTIERSADGKIWIGTNHGLSCLDTKTNLFKNFFADDGLQSNEFSDGASCIAPNGTLLFGGTGGITWFRPQDIVASKWEAKVSLTSFQVNGTQVTSASRSGSYQITETSVFASRRFELAYSDNSFAIHFSTLTYENPEHITYLYSVNGEPFIRLQQGGNVLTFSHLPSGTYRFRVKAEYNSVETPLREFTVVVHSPWYRSAWAYFFYALIVGLFAWQYLAYRRHREQSRLRLQAHMHAEEMGEAKLRFFMNMSHEIRTPMTLIVTPLMQLLKNEEDPIRRSVYLTIKRNAERILNLVNQMMDLRKVDKGQMQMHMRETDLVAFIKEIHDLFANQANTKRIALSFDTDAESLPVWIDRSNFDKVVMNVLSNAFKYTPGGGEIKIRLTHDAQQATIAISDDGEKIPEDKLDKIFERFYQTASTVNDRHAGTGIGLDLTRSLVELHHGTISAHNLEKGCEFVISIPLGNAHLKPEEMIVDDEAPAVVQPILEEEPLEEEIPAPVMELPQNRKLTLVIAEDDDEIRNYLESELEKDYDIRACINGREALGEIHRTLPDLVISDIMMPEMDGTTLCAKIKTNPETNFIPVILLTAKNRDEDKLEGLETGADAYIVKPFNMDILRRTILNLINAHRLLRLKYGRNDELEEQVEEIRLKSPDEKLLERIMDSINKNLSNSDLSVDMIADQAGISRVHLHRKMKELTGQTPHDFIRNIRLKKAAQLLTTQGMNVTEVMYACGFSNSASFSTVFKKFYGMSPRDYMREHEERS